MRPAFAKCHPPSLNHRFGHGILGLELLRLLTLLDGSIDGPSTVRRELNVLLDRVILSFPAVNVGIAYEAGSIVRGGRCWRKEKTGLS